MIRILCLLLFSTSLHATTFRTQPIEQQIRESDGVFQGNFLRSKTVELENGSLATQMIFKMTKETGLQSDFFGLDEVIIHYPGGSLGDRHVKVDGLPEFVPGEKVVLFIKNVENRYWGMNLGFGTFKVINYGNEVMLVNFIYPHHPQIGQVNYQYFERALKKIKGSSFKTVQTLQYPTAPQQLKPQRLPASERQNRTLASNSEQLDNEGDRPYFPMFWLIFFLGLTGGLFRLNRSRATK